MSNTPRRYDRKSDPENTALTREFRAVQLRVDDDLWVSSGVKYVGEAVDQMAATSDAKWRIRRYANVSPSGHIREEYAGIDQDIRVGEFNQVWDNRASLFPVVTTYPLTSFDGLATDRNQIFDILNSSKWMDLAVYDRVQASVLGNVMTLDYSEFSAQLGRATIAYTNSNSWMLSMARYLDEDDGSILLDDDASSLNLD